MLNNGTISQKLRQGSAWCPASEAEHSAQVATLSAYTRHTKATGTNQSCPNSLQGSICWTSLWASWRTSLRFHFGMEFAWVAASVWHGILLLEWQPITVCTLCQKQLLASSLMWVVATFCRELMAMTSAWDFTSGWLDREWKQESLWSSELRPTLSLRLTWLIC